MTVKAFWNRIIDTICVDIALLTIFPDSLLSTRLPLTSEVQLTSIHFPDTLNLDNLNIDNLNFDNLNFDNLNFDTLNLDNLNLDNLNLDIPNPDSQILAELPHRLFGDTRPVRDVPVEVEGVVIQIQSRPNHLDPATCCDEKVPHLTIPTGEVVRWVTGWKTLGEGVEVREILTVRVALKGKVPDYEFGPILHHYQLLLLLLARLTNGCRTVWTTDGRGSVIWSVSRTSTCRRKLGVLDLLLPR